MLAAGETSFHISSENYLALCLIYYYLGARARVRIQRETIPSHHTYLCSQKNKYLIVKPTFKAIFCFGPVTSISLTHSSLRINFSRIFYASLYGAFVNKMLNGSKKCIAFQYSEEM